MSAEREPRQPGSPGLPGLPHEYGQTRAREALIAEALADCAKLLDTARRSLQEAREVARDIEQATTAMLEQRTKLEQVISLYGQTLHTLDKGARERFTATIVEQTTAALNHASAELRRAGEAEQRLVANAAADAVSAAMRTHAPTRRPAQAPPASPLAPAAPSLLSRYFEWVSSPWGRRATVFMGLLAALTLYSSGILGRS